MTQVGIQRRNQTQIRTHTPLVNGKKILPEKIIDLMRSDKKVTNGTINLVLPREIGRVEIRNDVNENVIQDVLHETLHL